METGKDRVCELYIRGLIMKDSNRTKEDIYRKFQNPAREYRGTPFWSWNAEMTPEEVRRQVRELYEQGVGGFFIHSRDGLETPYLGREWMDCVEAAVDEAKQLGITAWLYDDDRWPSGNAGGMVAAGGDAYRLKGLTLQVCDTCDSAVWKEEHLIAVFTALVQGDVIYCLERLENAMTKVPEPEEKKQHPGCRQVFLILRLEISAKSEWFNGETPVDNLNPDTVQRFLHLTHDKYLERFGEEFGKTIPGIFTDEPSLADTHSAFGADRSWIPWTYGFAEYFREKNGYDPVDRIPLFFFEGEGSAKVRHDYWHAIALRFSENYSGQIAAWCREHHLLMTGHFLQEDKLGLSTRVSGATMPLYEYEDIPGVDILQDKTDEFLTVKQCVSVAHQMGKKNVISETYGVTGWDFTFEGQRHIGDWQYALGVNKRCQHLSLYSLTGGRKRDCPPGFGYNIPWWSRDHVVEDYFGRLSAALEEGSPSQQYLLLHPATTAWSMMGASPYGNPVRRKERDLQKVNEYGWQYNALLEKLCNHHLDPDLGDEILMAKHGSVEQGRLILGGMQYRTVVLPKIGTMLSSTYRLLKEFVKQGGQLIVTNPGPVLLDAMESNLPAELFTAKNCVVVNSDEELIKALEDVGARTVSIRSGDGEETRCIALQKFVEKGQLLFVTNYHRTEDCEVEIRVPVDASVEEWDALTGNRKTVEAVTGQGQTVFKAQFEAQTSRLFFLEKTAGKATGTSVMHTEADETELQRLPKRTAIRLTDPNLYTLDSCRYRIREGHWSEPMQVWEAQEQIRTGLGMRSIAALGKEQRYRWVREPHSADGTEVSLEFTFETVKKITGYTELAIEHPENFQIYLNGQPVEQRITGCLYDRGIKRIPLPGWAEGENRLRLTCRYRNSMELENCYLCGEFGVNTERKITEQPTVLLIGDWTSQGLCHYAGSCKRRPDSRIYLKLKDFKGTCATVRLGTVSYEVPWRAAGMIDITEALEEGDNHLEIEIYSSLRNLFGPFHLAGGRPEVTNDSVFRTSGEKYTPEYKVEPYGILKAPVLIER